MTNDDGLPLLERRLIRAVADTMHIPVCEFDLNLRVVYLNQAGHAILGSNPSLLKKGVSIDDLVAEDFRTLVRRGLEMLRTAQSSTSVSIRIVRRDGIEVPVEAYAALTHEQGAVCGYVVYLLDLRRRQLVEEKALEQRDLLQFAVEHSPVGILVVGTDFRFDYINDRLCEMLGRTRNEVLHHDFREFLHPDSIELVQDRYIRRQRGEKVPSVYEFKILHKDGHTVDVRIASVVTMTRGGAIKTVAHLHDITAELARERALKASEHRYRSLVETMVDGLAADNEDGIIIYANDALAKMVGYSSAMELVGVRNSDIIYGFTDSVAAQKAAARRAGITERYETSLIHRNGSLVPVLISASPMLDMDGRYIGSFGIFSDISGLKQAEARSTFLLDLLLHDVGNQLQLILGGVDLCSPDSPYDVIESSMQYIRDGSQRCLELIRKIRSVEEARNEPLKPTDLGVIIAAQVKAIEAAYGVRPKLATVPEHIEVLGDGAMSQLVWNILENAVRHNPRKDKMVWVRGKKTRTEFELRVSDNGPGLDDAQKERLLLSERRFGGVGFHIVRTLAAKYDATLMLEDRIEGDHTQGLSVLLVFKRP
ncbi:MAG: PAS domain S-box protein [Candidatus Thorarchaeota archaeon]|nr:PAS domain S-box protein [Candidatus Thorarchaeota archaeon]